jgi:hypothetical protein
MCTTCKDKTTPGAPPPDEFAYSVTGAAAGARVEYQGTIYNLDKLTCCQKRLLFGKTPFITRTPKAAPEPAPTGQAAPVATSRRRS